MKQTWQWTKCNYDVSILLCLSVDVHCFVSLGLQQPIRFWSTEKLEDFPRPYRKEVMQKVPESHYG